MIEYKNSIAVSVKTFSQELKCDIIIVNPQISLKNNNHHNLVGNNKILPLSKRRENPKL